jgi:hypothetical protein
MWKSMVLVFIKTSNEIPISRCFPVEENSPVVAALFMTCFASRKGGLLNIGTSSKLSSRGQSIGVRTENSGAKKLGVTMMRLIRHLAGLGLLMTMTAVSAAATPKTDIIEIVTLKIKPGVSVEAFQKIDAAVGSQHVAKQPGFISRESASSGENEWLVIVHWRSTKDADASMASFASAPAAKEFIDSIDSSTMVMKRYTQR